MGRGVVAAVALLGASGALVGSILAWSACYPQGQCPASTIDLPPEGGPPVGEMIDENTYETSPFDDPKHPWIDYPGNVTLVIAFPESVRQATAGRGISGIRGWVSQSKNIDDPGNQFVETSGQPAAYFDAGAAGFAVNNETCQGYSARFEVSFYPAGGDAGTPMAEAGADVADSQAE